MTWNTLQSEFYLLLANTSTNPRFNFTLVCSRTTTEVVLPVWLAGTRSAKVSSFKRAEPSRQRRGHEKRALASLVAARQGGARSTEIADEDVNRCDRFSNPGGDSLVPVAAERNE